LRSLLTENFENIPAYLKHEIETRKAVSVGYNATLSYIVPALPGVTRVDLSVYSVGFGQHWANPCQKLSYLNHAHSREPRKSRCYESPECGLPLKTVSPNRLLVRQFKWLKDARWPLNSRHLFGDNDRHRHSAIHSRADGWIAISQSRRSQRARYQRIQELHREMPAHDTLRLLSELRTPSALDASFRVGVQSVSMPLAGDTFAIDSKAEQAAQNRDAGIAPPHSVSAWTTKHRLVLGQVAKCSKHNAFAAMRPLPNLLDIQGCIVTSD
jgi:hypothetical protein